MNIRFSLILVLTMCTWTAFAEKALPSNAAHLRDFLNNEKALVDAARQYHLQQMDLTQWDYEIIEEATRDSDDSVQISQRDILKARSDSIRKVWEYVLSIFPGSTRAMNYFGEYWYDLGGNQQAAVNYWKRAIVGDRRMSLAYNNLGIHYFHTGDYIRGLRSLDAALENDPENPDILFNMAQMYLNHFPIVKKIKGLSDSKAFSKAMGFSEKAAKLSPNDFSLAQDFAVNFFAGENFDVDVRWDKAAEAWSVAHRIAENKQDEFYTLLNEGRCWVQDENFKKALVLFEAALKYHPDSIVVQDLILDTRMNEDAK